MRTLISSNPNSEDEAIGYALRFSEKEMKGFGLLLKCVTCLTDVYSEEEMINSAKYGYEYHSTTSFPEENFEDNCKNNFLQKLQS